MMHNRYGVSRLPLGLNDQCAGVTVELRQLVEAGVKVWDFDYPSFYQGEEKTAFEQKVLDHFWFRQIGQETPGRFLHMFRSKVRDIMPYYIELYKSAKAFSEDPNPLESYNLEETFIQDTQSSGRASSESESNGENTRKFSDTPQGNISNLEKFLTEATQEGSEGSEKSSGSSENTGKVTHTLIRKGNIGVQSLGEEYVKNRKAIINVDLMIIEELNDLFLKVY